jgi:hypothetical protein
MSTPGCSSDDTKALGAAPHGRVALAALPVSCSYTPSALPGHYRPKWPPVVCSSLLKSPAAYGLQPAPQLLPAQKTALHTSIWQAALAPGPLPCSKATPWVPGVPCNVRKRAHSPPGRMPSRPEGRALWERKTGNQKLLSGRREGGLWKINR